MLSGRGAGGPKQSKWKKGSNKAFGSYFGKRSGGEPLPASPPDVTQSGVEIVDFSSEARAGTAATAANTSSDVLLDGDEHLIEAMLCEARRIDELQPPSPSTERQAEKPPAVLCPTMDQHATPLEQKIFLGRELVNFIVAARVQGVRSQARTPYQPPPNSSAKYYRYLAPVSPHTSDHRAIWRAGSAGPLETSLIL